MNKKLIILLSLIILITGVYVVYKKIETKPIDNNSEQTKEPNNNLSNWMNYLLESNIQKISISKCSSVIYGDEEDSCKKIDLTKEELEIIFSRLNNYNLKKMCLGATGFAGNDLTFSVSYLVDGIEYKFILLRGGYILTNNFDTELLSLFNSNNYPMTGSNGELCYFKYITDINFDSIFERYFV